MKEQMRESELSEGLPGGQEKTYFAVVTLFWISMYVNIPFQTPYSAAASISSSSMPIAERGLMYMLIRSDRPLSFSRW